MRAADSHLAHATLALRERVRASDGDAVVDLVRATEMFSEAEVEIAAELVEVTLRDGDVAGYRFAFVDRASTGGADGVDAYCCYGPIPGTASSFDLYWIAVRPGLFGRGIGRYLMRHCEQRVVESGGTHVWVDTSGRAQYAGTRAFYVAAGYSLVAELPDFYGSGDSKCVFVRDLRGR